MSPLRRPSRAQGIRRVGGPWLLVPFALGLTLSPAAAQQARKGFVLDLGLGVATTNTSVSVGGVDGDAERNTGLAVDFKIGYAPVDQLLIYYNADGVLFRPSYTDAADLWFAASALNGIGATAFLNPTAPSPYVRAAMGQGAWAEVEDFGSADGFTGRGYSLGAGYEFAPHWLVDVGVVVTRPKHDRGPVTDTYETTTWRLAVLWLLY